MAAEATGTTNQQREFARVDDTLPLSWRRVSDQEMADILAHYEKFRAFPTRHNDIEQILNSLDVTDRLKQLERSDPTLSRILSRMDIKLNLLLRLFHPGEQERPMVPTWMNLSGGGIAFKEENCDMEAGEMLELRISFSLEVMASVLCYVRVMKVFPPDGEGFSKVAGKFEPILDGDRESLIQHIFKRQTEEIRAKRSR
ncbi:MAG: PilZ domain-containing protein [Magnetococcales bacterium]|nr:PilZ domain-containing protein [Magnetococcales bacterium]